MHGNGRRSHSRHYPKIKTYLPTRQCWSSQGLQCSRLQICLRPGIDILKLWWAYPSQMKSICLEFGRWRGHFRPMLTDGSRPLSLTLLQGLCLPCPLQQKPNYRLSLPLFSSHIAAQHGFRINGRSSIRLPFKCGWKCGITYPKGRFGPEQYSKGEDRKMWKRGPKAPASFLVDPLHSSGSSIG